MSDLCDAQAMAAQAEALWGANPGSAKLIKMRENIVFRLTFADGSFAALRLHRPGYQSREMIEAELDWATMLAQGGLIVPIPRKTLAGATVAPIGPRIASVVSWLKGDAMGDAARPLAGSADEQRSQFHALGRYLGDLHRLTDKLALGADVRRHSWDVDGLLGESPIWGRFWENPAFSAQDLKTVLPARDLARAQLSDLRARGADFGLIHADVLRENILLTPDGLALIDFDDSGYGFRHYDLGTALVQNLEEPHLAILAVALADGYTLTRPTAAPILPRLTLFILLRCLASAGWIMTRATADDPRQAFYVQRALRLSRHLLDETTPWD